MTDFLNQLRKYHRSTTASVLAAGLFGLMMLCLWLSRNHALEEGFLRGGLLALVVMGFIIGFCEQVAIETSIAWALPGHLRRVRRFTTWVYLGGSLVVMGIFVGRSEPFPMLQTLALGAVAMLALNLGLLPRLFPAQAMCVAPLAPLFVLNGFIWSYSWSTPFLENAIMETPILLLLLSASVATFSWLRLGDRRLVQRALNCNRIDLVDFCNPAKLQEFRDRTEVVMAKARNSNRATRWETRLFQWLSKRLRDRSTSPATRLLLGCLVHVCEAKTLLQITVVVPIVALIMLGAKAIIDVLGGDPISSIIPVFATIPPAIAILTVFMIVGMELCHRQQAVLALPFTRRDLLQARWTYLGLLFGFCVIAITAFFAIESLIHAQFPGWADSRWFPPGWTSYLNTLPLAAAPATFAGLAFIGRHRVGRLLSDMSIGVFFIGYILSTNLSALSLVDSSWAWAFLAALWIVIAAQLPRRTLNEDELV
jgi:hypothetical protein